MPRISPIVWTASRSGGGRHRLHRMMKIRQLVSAGEPGLRRIRGEGEEDVRDAGQACRPLQVRQERAELENSELSALTAIPNRSAAGGHALATLRGDIGMVTTAIHSWDKGD